MVHSLSSTQEFWTDSLTDSQPHQLKLVDIILPCRNIKNHVPVYIYSDRSVQEVWIVYHSVINFNKTSGIHIVIFIIKILFNTLLWILCPGIWVKYLFIYAGSFLIVHIIEISHLIWLFCHLVIEITVNLISHLWYHCEINMISRPMISHCDITVISSWYLDLWYHTRDITVILVPVTSHMWYHCEVTVWYHRSLGSLTCDITWLPCDITVISTWYHMLTRVPWGKNKTNPILYENQLLPQKYYFIVSSYIPSLWPKEELCLRIQLVCWLCFSCNMCMNFWNL